MKAQVKMGTTIAVLFIFFVILVFGFIFYTKIESINIARDQQVAEAQRSIQVAGSIVNLPELQCTLGGVERGVCFDIYKIKAMETLVNSHWTYYYDFFGFGNISINGIYPDDSLKFHIYENTGNRTSFTTTHIPITLYNASSREYYFGILAVSSFY